MKQLAGVVVSGMIVCSSFLLAACGQKGPLYLPEDAPPSKPYSACDVADAPCRERVAKAPAATTEAVPVTPASAPESNVTPGVTPSAPSTEYFAP